MTRHGWSCGTAGSGCGLPTVATFRVDEHDDVHRTVRPIWTRDRDNPSGPGFDGSLSSTERDAFVKQSAEATRGVEPPPFTVDRLYLSSLGAWLDWRVAWRPNDAPSAYRHLATLGRDQYVRVEWPIYLFPFGHRATLVEITERKIDPKGTNPAAYLFKRQFIVLRDHTLRYDAGGPPTKFPFLSVTVDPVTSPDLDDLPSGPVDPFVPQVKKAHYLWKITAVDHALRQVTMTSALLAVPVNRGSTKSPATEWVDQVVTPDGLIDLGDAEVAFAPETHRGDTTSRIQSLGVDRDLTTRHQHPVDVSGAHHDSGAGRPQPRRRNQRGDVPLELHHEWFPGW